MYIIIAILRALFQIKEAHVKSKMSKAEADAYDSKKMLEGIFTFVVIVGLIVAAFLFLNRITGETVTSPKIPAVDERVAPQASLPTEDGSAEGIVTDIPVGGSGATRWANVNFLGFKAGESARDTVAHARMLGLSRIGECKFRRDAKDYVDCKFSGGVGESMDVSFYSGQLQRVDYTFAVDRYEEILRELKEVNGQPRVMTDPYNSSVFVSDEWGSSKEKYSISLGKTFDGVSGFAEYVLEPEISDLN